MLGLPGNIISLYVYTKLAIPRHKINEDGCLEVGCYSEVPCPQAEGCAARSRLNGQGKAEGL